MMTKRVSTHLLLLLVLVVVTLQQLAYAHVSHEEISSEIFDLDQVRQWLSSQQGVEGSVYSEPAISSAIDATSHALLASYSGIDGGFLDNESALFWLNENGGENLNDLSWRINLAAITGTEYTDDVNTLINLQNSDGGFASHPGFDSSPIETALALLALGAADYDDGSVLGGAIAYLLQSQNSDGSFYLYESSQDSVWVTALVVQSLRKYLYIYDISTALAGAVEFLYSQQGLDGNWASNWESAQSLLAVVPLTTDVSRYIDVVIDLHTAQLLDGSWDRDVYTTALIYRVVDLLLNMELPTDLNKGRIIGSVMDEITLQPVQGIVITIEPSVGVEPVIEGNGKFTLSALEEGSYTVTYSAPGYLSLFHSIELQAGQLRDVGSIRMKLAPTTGLITGSITDKESGLPISGASIKASVSGSVFEQVVGGNGQYDLVVAPGATNLEIAASGYITQYAIANITLGSQLTFNTSLEKFNSDESEFSTELIGVIVDSVTKLPLSNVSITQQGSGKTILSSADGSFLLQDIDFGDIKIDILLADYAGTQLAFSLPENRRGDLGVVELIHQSNQAPLSSISGFVVDGLTGESLSGVTVSIVSSGADVSAVSDDDGAFSIADLKAGLLVVEFSKQGFTTFSGDLLLAEKTRTDIGVIQMQSVIVVETSTVSGRVTDGDTGLAISDASINVHGINVDGIVVTTNSNGDFSVDTIEALEFIVDANVPGYSYGSILVSLAEPGSVNVDLRLLKSEIGGIVVNSTLTNKAHYGAYESVLITTEIENITIQEKSIRLFVEVKDVNNNVIDYFPAVNLPLISELSDVDAWKHYQAHYRDALEVLAPRESRTIQIEMPWYTQSRSPGIYYVSILAVDGESSRLLSELSVPVVVDPTQNIINLVVKSTPDFSLIESDVNVQLSAFLENRSNVPVDLELYYELLAPNSDVLLSGSQSIHIDVSEREKTLSLDSLQYQFMVSGTYPISLKLLSGPSPAKLDGRRIFVPPNVRIEMTQTLSPQTVVPETNVTVEHNIELKGFSGE